MKTQNIIYTWTLVVVLHIFFTHSSNADTLTVYGVYQGKNLIAQNSLLPGTQSYCTKEIWINNVRSGINTNQGAFEIDLSFLKQASPVEIKIVRNGTCDFKIINEAVISVKSTFAIPSVSVQENSVVWSNVGENSAGQFIIERFQHGRWDAASETVASSSKSSYNAPVVHHSSENTYRIRFKAANGKNYYSETISYVSAITPLEVNVLETQKKITFSRKAAYKISDSTDVEVLAGNSTEISLSTLAPGIYYLEADNRTIRIKIPANEY